MLQQRLKVMRCYMLIINLQDIILGNKIGKQSEVIYVNVPF